MKETFTPALVIVDDEATTLDDVAAFSADHPDQVGFRHRVDGKWVDVTYREFYERVRELACGLVAAGIACGDRVALMSKTRFEWALCDYAIWQVGAVTVPIYETSSAEQVEWALYDSGAVAAFIETDVHGSIVAEVSGRTPALRHTWVLEHGCIDELVTMGHVVSVAALDDRRSATNADSLATIVYTSGTTGRPKGCMLTHRNLVSVYANTAKAPGIAEIFNDRSSALLFLPLAHVLARIIELSCIHSRVCIGFTPTIKELPADMASFKPTLVLSVPRVFEKIYNTAEHKAISAGKGRIFERATKVAITYSEALDRHDAGLVLRLQHALFDRLVYGKIRASMGGNVAWSVSGGAPLGARLGHFFRGVGVNVLEGWGMTETSTAGTLNLPSRQRMGSVGPAVPGCGLRIADDGEVLVRGPFIMSGYWQDEVATKETIDEDGWLHTGDIGEIDDDGFLFITGRKKELIVTSGGKNVAPAVLEDRLRAHWLVSQCIVVGDCRPFIGCLVTLDQDALAQWCADKSRPAATAAELRQDPEILAGVSEAVEEANKAVSKAEAIREFRILDIDFTEASGHLTPTLKLKRSVVAAQFSTDIDDLYS
jgi:long-chain acyl-CoA synthetase